MNTRQFTSGAAWRTHLRSWTDVERLHQHEDKVLLALTLVIGAVVGIVVVAFILLTEGLSSRFFPNEGASWRATVFPIVGALFTGILLRQYFPNARGSGIPQTKAALLLNDGRVTFRTVLGKFTCSSVSLASGIALGREGPAVHIGAGIASVLGRRLGLGPRSVRSLVPVGCAAALAAAFNTPIAAVLFTLEEVLGDLHAPVLGSIVLSSATSWAVLHLLLGDEPLFHVPAYQLVHPVEFANYAILGVAGGLVSVCFVKLLLRLRFWFLRLPSWSESLQPAAGGLVVGLLAWFVPGVLGVGYTHVGEALNGNLLLSAMPILLVLKIVATATCYASGNAGGIFGPSLFIGAMLGGTAGTLAHSLLPDFTASPGAYALIGMGTAFAGIIRAPMTSAIMIFEITRDYSIIVPVMIANLLSYFISQRLQREPIYEALLHQDRIHLPPVRNVASTITVAEGARSSGTVLTGGSSVSHELAVLDRTTAREGFLPLSQAPNAWAVVERGNRLLGMVTRTQMERAVQEGRGEQPLSDIMDVPGPATTITAATFPHVHPDHPLDSALWRMAASGLNVLPVVSRRDTLELLGTISLENILESHAANISQDHAPGARHMERMSGRALLATVLAAFIGLAAVAGFLTHYYRLQRETSAQRAYEMGNELSRANRPTEAVQQFRNALSLQQSNEYRLTLALELMKVDQLTEASIYLAEVLDANPRSGPAHAAAASVAAEQGQTDLAVQHYAAAIAGDWPSDAARHRIDTRFDLVDFLQKTGATERAVSALLELAADKTLDLPTRMRIGRRLLDLGAAAQSADMFAGILADHPDNAEAYAGLGTAEFARDRYEAAQAAFERAHDLDPEDATSAQRLEVLNRILSLDLGAVGLSTQERDTRSRNLLEGTLAAFDACLTSRPEPPAEANVKSLVDAARTALGSRRPVRSRADAADARLELTRDLWAQQKARCGARLDDEALQLVLTKMYS